MSHTFDHLWEFITNREDAGDLLRISAEVDAVCEVSEIVNRMRLERSGGPALFFENIRGCTVPMVSNLLGTEQRFCLALGIDSIDDLTERFASLLRPDFPDGWADAIKRMPQLTQLARLPAKSVKTAVCQQVVKMGRDIDLQEFPIPTHWPDDAAPTISQGLMFVRDPQSGRRHLLPAPLLMTDAQSFHVLWTARDEGFRLLTDAVRRGERLQVAVALGGDPYYRL